MSSLHVTCNFSFDSRLRSRPTFCSAASLANLCKRCELHSPIAASMVAQPCASAAMAAPGSKMETHIKCLMKPSYALYRYCWPNTHDCLRQKIVLHAYALVNSVMYHMSRLLIHAIAAGCSYLYALRGYVTCDCTVAIAPRTVKTITKTLDTTRL